MTVQRDSEELARLLQALAAGDQGALRVLYERTAPKLLGVLLRILRDRAAAEDALQDVFVRVWQRAAGYDPAAGAPLAWLVAIARHRAIDAVRQERARRMTAQDEGGWLDRLADDRDGEAEFARRDALARCLEGLEAAQRDCVVRAYYEGLSREELAERFGRPVNTIKTWLRRGLISLRGCLEAA